MSRKRLYIKRIFIAFLALALTASVPCFMLPAHAEEEDVPAVAGQTQDLQEQSVQEETREEEVSDQTDETVTLMEDETGASGAEQTPSVRVLASRDKEMTFTAQAAGLSVQTGQKVEFAVWSAASGQDDLKFYAADAVDDGTYAAVIDITGHKSCGTYQVQVCLRTDGQSDEECLNASPAGTTFRVTPATGKAAISSVNGTKGTFVVTGSKIRSVSGVKKVIFKVWQAADKSDVRSYAAARQSDGSYKAAANVKKHKRHFGKYHVRMVVTMKNGILSNADTAARTITAKNYIYAVKANSSGTQYTVRILNAKNGSSWARSVRFKTWSKTKGKNDVKYYKGKKYGSHNWRCVVKSKNHVFGGKYYSAAYNNSKKLSLVSYSMKRVLSEAEKQAEARLNKCGRTLYKAFRWSAAMPYRTVTAGMCRDCDMLASYGFANRCGDCGVMAATFYHMARRLGYKAHFVTGYVPLAGGGMGPHAWVEIVQNGSTWVYDPDFQHESGRNGFKTYYGAGGTWRYSSYSRVN